MTTPDPQYFELKERLAQTLRDKQSPLTVVEHDPAEMLEYEIGFHDSRFDTPLIVSGERLEALARDRSIADMATGVENLSAAFVIADEVEATTMDGYSVHAPYAGFSDNALQDGIVSLYSVEDEMTVDGVLVTVL